MIASFLSRMGIKYMPLLFLGNAIMIMLGSLIYRQVLRRVNREVLISFTSLIAAAVLIVSLNFIYKDNIAFFVMLLISQGVFISQILILLSLFNEEIFTPLESQRTFPLIESAETMGGMAGGFLLTFFSNTLPSYKFIIIWILSLILILPIVLRFNLKNFVNYEDKKNEKLEKPKPSKLHSSIFALKKIPFIKGLMIVIILNWAIINVVEFQYTKAVQEDVTSTQEETLVDNESIANQDDEQIILASTENPVDQIKNKSETEIETYEHKVTKKLGILHIVFNAGALIMQLVFASRIITALGISSTMLLHPLVTLLNLVAMTLRFNFLTAATTRGTYELTRGVFKNAYHSSYYAIPGFERGEVKEIMQGLMRPIGSMIGTGFIILIANIYTGSNLTLTLNVGLIIMALIMVLYTSNLKQKYSDLSEQNLSRKVDLATRINAVEILAQKGHEKLPPALKKILFRPNEPSVLKAAILKTLAERQELDSINIILKMLNDKSDRVRLSAVKAVGDFKILRKSDMTHSFTRYQVVESLKTRLESESQEFIREAIIKILYKLSPDHATNFIIGSIKETEGAKKAGFIRMLRVFEDPNLKSFLNPYLNSKNIEIRAAAIIALWQFKDMRNELKHFLKQMLESGKDEILKFGIEVAGLVEFDEAESKIEKLTKHENKAISDAAILALARMGNESNLNTLIEKLMDETHEWYEEILGILESLPKTLKEKILAIIE